METMSSWKPRRRGGGGDAGLVLNGAGPTRLSYGGKEGVLQKEGSWEQGLSPADVLPATFFIPGSLQFIKGGSKHTRRIFLQMAGVHAGPQWT